MNKFISFSTNIDSYELPNEFAYPHNYTPHPLAKIAAQELQNYLVQQHHFEHDFGLNTNSSKNAVGKMFGVLVVQDPNGKIGYLAAFSGKLANATQHQHFVPPVFDVLDKQGIYLTTEVKLNELTQKIEMLQQDPLYLSSKAKYRAMQESHQQLLTEEQYKIHIRRKRRKQAYRTIKSKLNSLELETYQAQLNQQKINEEFYLREYTIYLNAKLSVLEQDITPFKHQLTHLQQQRTELSAWVQQEIFKRYAFLNILGISQNIQDIFSQHSQPIPAGAGDCCAPKLLQYAFLHQLKPIAMAEFWWGKPLATAIRKHQHFYPACTGKCKPILTHMLQGISVATNPIVQQLQHDKDLEVIFEDEYLLVINKPAELLSAPGKEIKDSVYTRIKKRYPQLNGPLVVHRLDMSTSGILLIAKNIDIYKALQEQFIQKTIQKRYVALLEGKPLEQEGTISLPLRVDLDDRPKQLVCQDHGKAAITQWETIATTSNYTKVYFYPITGRTHQLRVHAAHQLGLNAPIVGDDLYGTKAGRLHLHAETIRFQHPISKEWVAFTTDVPF